ncbi:hypothetical protein [Herbidospora cretacea]|uniref:hypothetical protein n=1 Tax=Herbidospora cretacea TaxID=28444 RepID=UPI0007739E93|nr:hypothetical protein [Herbidospora cretacea]
MTQTLVGTPDPDEQQALFEVRPRISDVLRAFQERITWAHASLIDIEKSVSDAVLDLDKATNDCFD